jgi:hypothetical protein
MSITSANSTLYLGVTSLFNTPQQMIGFAQDDAYEVDAVDPVEALIGVDGIMSTGWVPQIKIMHVTLQPDSVSNVFFEAWYASQEAQREIYQAFGTIYQPGISRAYALTNGVLANYTPLAAGKKVLAPRRFQIKWQTILGAPA